MIDIEREQRAAVVAEALTWAKTPYHHMGRVKGAGTDCAQFVYCVFHASGIIPFIPLTHYPRDWHLHRDAERYQDAVLEYAVEIERSQPGDIVLYRIGRAFAHGGIVLAAGWPHIIHADAEANFVIPDHGDQGRRAGRARKFFSVWGACA